MSTTAHMSPISPAEPSGRSRRHSAWRQGDRSFPCEGSGRSIGGLHTIGIEEPVPGSWIRRKGRLPSCCTKCLFHFHGGLRRHVGVLRSLVAQVGRFRTVRVQARRGGRKGHDGGDLLGQIDRPIQRVGASKSRKRQSRTRRDRLSGDRARVGGKWRECSTVSSANGGKSARTIGIDLADLHKMAPGAGDGTTFLVIQAISKKSISRLTSISRLEKATWKIGTGSQPRIAVHHSADFPPFARDARSRVSPHASLSPFHHPHRSGVLPQCRLPTRDLHQAWPR